jgi:ADP-ribose pyrophosphatase YjhB (NUDIX family)
VRQGEQFERGVQREAHEELGIHIELERYLVSTEATFRGPTGTIDWRTHVFSASTAEELLDPVDTHEISAARWGSAEELAGPIRDRLLETGRALWRYRVALHDAALDQLQQLL